MSEKKSYDIAIIGSGPGGYVAAIKAAQLGKKTALIEKGEMGGVCLNVGCIPTKTLLAGSHILKKIKEAKEFGITVGSLSFDFSAMKKRKDKVVDGLRSGLSSLMKQNGIDIYHGSAKFSSPTELKITGKENLLLEAKKIIIATGSEPLDIKAFPCDHKRILNSTSILDITELPKTIAIIGGGYIGCEFASLYAELGVKVVLIEAQPTILSLLGKLVSQTMTRAFQKQGIQIETNASVEGIDNLGNQVKVRLKEGKTIDADLALVAIGRKISSEGLDLAKAGVKTGSKGEIEVDDRMETSNPGTYAIGDVTGIAMLAHVASHQGMVAASNACGIPAHMHYHAVPAVVFTTPEIAMVGMTEEQAEKEGRSFTTGTFPFQALGKAIAAHETEGFAQLLSDPKTGEILGAQVIGYEASTLIAEMALAIQNELTLDCLIDTIHAHPTIAEAWLESALLANNTPINFPPKRKNR